jgi:hypothetical protein
VALRNVSSCAKGGGSDGSGSDGGAGRVGARLNSAGKEARIELAATSGASAQEEGFE